MNHRRDRFDVADFIDFMELELRRAKADFTDASDDLGLRRDMAERQL